MITIYIRDLSVGDTVYVGLTEKLYDNLQILFEEMGIDEYYEYGKVDNIIKLGE